MTVRLADLAILTPRFLPTLVVLRARVGPRPDAEPNLSHTDRRQSLQDPAFKMVFCHPVAIERLVRTYASEYADRIDFSTLEKLDAELVGEALVRRYPDMLWMARTSEGPGRVVIQLEFQGARDRLMALRMAVYQLLTVQQLFRRRPSLHGGRPLEMLSFVIYHGRGSAKASTSLQQLFPRWVPGNYRVVSRSAGGFEGDLAQTILKLERDHSVEGTLAAVAVLTRIADETGTGYDRLMAECVGEMLVSTKRITREQLREVRTMAQVETTYQRSLEEYGKRWFRQGRDEGIRQGRDEGIRQGRDEGQAAMLMQLVREKFGPETAEELSALLGRLSDSGEMSVAARAVLESATSEELLHRMRGL